MRNQRLRNFAMGILTLGVLFGSGITHAQTVDSVLQQSQENTESLAAAQRRINGIAEQTQQTPTYP